MYKIETTSVDINSVRKVEIIEILLNNFYEKNTDKLKKTSNTLFLFSTQSGRIDIGTNSIQISHLNKLRFISKSWRVSYEQLKNISSKNGEVDIPSSLGTINTSLNNDDLTIIKEINSIYNSSEKEYQNILELRKKEEQDKIEENILELRKKEEKYRIEELERKEKEKIRLKKLEISKFDYVSKLDKDGNGEIDLIDCDSFTKLLNTKQKNIIEIDKNYIQKFVKISIYLKTKKSNIQKLFQSIKSVKNDNELDELVGLLQNQVHTYNLLIFHSINMVTSLTESELITFYEIYECFDKLGVFNSNWENEVSSNLQNINYSIDEVNQSIINLDNNMSNNLQKLMYSIHDMESNIIKSINELTYITEDSFSNLNHTVGEQLSDINSSLNFNNLLTGIQTYQMYKINQNTKRIN